MNKVNDKKVSFPAILFGVKLKVVEKIFVTIIIFGLNYIFDFKNRL